MTTVAPSARTDYRVTVNPINCLAHGLCAELLPERVTLDEWGYPIIDGRPLNEDEYRHAVRAAKSCPTLALLLVEGR